MANASILVVDDEPAIQDILTWSLAAEGYNVATAASGEEALSRFAEQDFDVIVTDIVMPGLNGLELLERSRVLNPRASVIVMTAYAALETAITALRRGALKARSSSPRASASSYNITTTACARLSDA